MLLKTSPEEAHKELLQLCKEGRELRNQLHDAGDDQAVAAVAASAATWMANASRAGATPFRDGQHLAAYEREFGRNDRRTALGGIAERVAEIQRREVSGTYDRRQLRSESLRLRDDAIRHLDSLLDVLGRQLTAVEDRLPVRELQPQPKIFYSWQIALP
jgi:hypothetical protein